ncbi:MAG: proprotein convertase P-domain-containing protein [Myxococcales bacterium]|nr:proprotein convertase P-domain-containing protein [Myxococcales bacterium]
MSRLPLLLVASSIGLFACATPNDPTGGGGSESPGGGGGGDPVAGAGTGGDGGQGIDCAQDCSEIAVPNCYLAVCNPETGVCEIAAAEDGTDCEDGLFCTTGDTCESGVCQAGGPIDCTDGDDDPCLVAACDEDEDSCSTATAPNGTACISTDICTSNAICQNGLCLGAPLDCSLTPLTAPDCQVAECDPGTGQCVVLSANDGQACIYGDICESDKTCSAGVCEGTPIAECTSCTETEINNDFSTANSGVGCAAWAGALTTLGDIDCFEIEVTIPGSRVTATVTDVSGFDCPPGFNPFITLYDATGDFLASDAFSAGNCATFLPDNTGATNLPAGTYSVCVEDVFGGGTSPPYLLLLDSLPPGCGNGIIEATEECDGTNVGFEDCISQGFGSGTLACDASCAFDTSACALPFCGDGFQNGTEECDGFDFGGATCVSEGFAGGTIACGGGCTLNTAGCVMPGCNNGLLELGEDCDGSPASCTASCTFACGPGQVPFSVNGVTPVAIPDFGLCSSTAAVGATGTIASVSVQINLTHTFDADLAISVISPAGTSVPLSTNNGGSDDDFANTVFSSQAITSIAFGLAPFQGVFNPDGSLTSFNGQSPTGTWTLSIDDQAGGDSGTINGWRVFGCLTP